MCCYVVGNYGFYDFKHAKQTELNLTSLHDVWYTTFLCTKCNGCVVLTLTLEHRLWKRVCTVRVWDRYYCTRGLTLRIITLTPLCKYKSEETVYTNMNSEHTERFRVVAGFSSRGSMFIPKPFFVGFVADRVVMRQVFLPKLRMSSVSIIPPLFHTDMLSICCWNS